MTRSFVAPPEPALPGAAVKAPVRPVVASPGEEAERVADRMGDSVMGASGGTTPLTGDPRMSTPSTGQEAPDVVCDVVSTPGQPLSR